MTATSSPAPRSTSPASRAGRRRPATTPLVYISFGTAYTDRADLYTQFATELAPDHRVVIATGKVDPQALPDTVTKARTMPQLDVLEHADVFITHAGMGGANEALWYGVPVVAAPQAVDQFANAATLEAIGAGVQLGDMTAREAVEKAREWPAGRGAPRAGASTRRRGQGRRRRRTAHTAVSSASALRGRAKR